MPSLEHSGLVEMFRENPSLAPHFLSTLFAVELPEHTSARVADSTLDQLIPVEFRADLVVELRDAGGAVVLAIVLEVQRDRDPRKYFTWPVYLAVARAERQCPAVLLVIAPDASVAAWAATKLDLGLGLTIHQPLVLGPDTIPLVTDPAEAEKVVELAVLAAMAHGNGSNGMAVLSAAFRALAHVDGEHAAVYARIIYKALREPMRQALEKLMEQQSEDNDPLPPFMQKLIDRGFGAGRVEGRVEGKVEGKVEGIRESLLRLIERAGIPLTDADRTRIQACDDIVTLQRWLDNVFGAKTAADILS